MPNLKIAYSPKVEQYFSTHRELVEITKTDFTDVSAIVLTSGDVGDYLERIQATNFGIPVFVVQTEEEQVDPKFYDAIASFLLLIFSICFSKQTIQHGSLNRVVLSV